MGTAIVQTSLLYHTTAPYNYILYLPGDFLHSSVQCRCTHGMFKAMYTTETTIGPDSIVGHRLVSPHTDRYLILGLSFGGGVFKEQQMTFV